jgi:hypothetical protein
MDTPMANYLVEVQSSVGIDYHSNSFTGKCRRGPLLQFRILAVCAFFFLLGGVGATVADTANFIG